MRGIYAVMALIMVLGSAFVVCSDDSDAVEASSVFVKFSTTGPESGEDGTQDHPYTIQSTLTSRNLPDGIQDEMTLYVLDYEDVASDPGSYSIVKGHYDIDKSVTIDGTYMNNAERWNVYFNLKNNVSLTLNNMTFGELYVNGVETERSSVSINGCTFTMDGESVNLTDVSSTNKTQQRHNARCNNVGMTVTGCTFTCTGVSDEVTKTYAVYPLPGAHKLIVQGCIIDGYNSAINVDISGDAEITGNIFENITNRKGTESGFAVQVAGHNTEKITISYNKVTAKDPVEGGEENAFLSIHETLDVRDEPVMVDKNKMFNFGIGVKYQESSGITSGANVAATGNLFSEDGVTATEMVVAGADETQVVQTNPVSEVPFEEPEVPEVPVVPPFIDDDDDYVPVNPITPAPSTDSDDEEGKVIVIAAAAAVVAVLAALFIMMGKGKI